MIVVFIEWFDFSKALSLAAFCISILSLYFSGVRSRLAKAQELRRKPNLALTLVHSQFRDGIDDQGRLYAFKLSVNNRADNKNAIAKASLSISYLTKNHFQMKMKFLATDKPIKQALPIPIEIDPHNTVAGWIYFHVPTNMLKGNIIETYTLTLKDTHDKSYFVDETFLQEVKDAEI